MLMTQRWTFADGYQRFGLTFSLHLQDEITETLKLLYLASHCDLYINK